MDTTRLTLWVNVDDIVVVVSSDEVGQDRAVIMVTGRSCDTLRCALPRHYHDPCRCQPIERHMNSWTFIPCNRLVRRKVVHTSSSALPRIMAPHSVSNMSLKTKDESLPTNLHDGAINDGVEY